MSSKPSSSPAQPQRFPIRFGKAYSVLSSAVGLLPAQAYIDVGETVEVRMGWAFRARFPRSMVISATRYEGHPLSRGVHGLAGSWLVNGAGDRVLQVDLRAAGEARVLGLPVSLQTLLVSVDDPEALASSLIR